MERRLAVAGLVSLLSLLAGLLYLLGPGISTYGAWECAASGRSFFPTFTPHHLDSELDKLATFLYVCTFSLSTAPTTVAILGTRFNRPSPL